MTKLKIDLRSGVLEVEGEESFVREIYNEYKEKISTAELPVMDEVQHAPQETESHSRKPRVKRANGSKTTSKRKESYQIVKDLDLSAKGGKEALKSYYSEKAPSTAMERNTLFVYYLEKIASAKAISVNHIYTCYKDVNEKVPGALRQSLLDTSYKKGWIDTKSMENITITTHGENLVEHTLPVKKEK